MDSSETGRSYVDGLRELVRRKRVEVEKLIADAQTMKQVLEAGLVCRCAKIEDCLLFVKKDK